MVGILGGACAVVAIGGIALVGWSMARNAPVAAEDEAGEEPITAAQLVAEVNNPVEGNPADANPAVGPTPSANLVPNPTIAGPSAAEKVITSQVKWSNVLLVKAIKLNSVSLQITSAWLASDAAGTRVNPVLPGAAAAPAIAPPAAAELGVAAPAEAPAAPAAPVAPPTAAAVASPAKYVFVEVKITNGSPVPKKYASWNGADATAVVLADQANQVLDFVPPAATPTVSRHGTVQLAPGQAVTDVLVFAAPPQPIEMLKLALLKTALADAAKGHWAFEIPLEALFPPSAEEGSQRIPAVAEGAPPAPNRNGGQPDSVGALNAQLKGPDRSPDALPPATAAPPATPPVAAPPAAPAVDPTAPKKPPTAAELNKQFEELGKKEAPATPVAPKPGETPASPTPAKPDPAAPQPAEPKGAAVGGHARRKRPLSAVRQRQPGACRGRAHARPLPDLQGGLPRAGFGCAAAASSAIAGGASAARVPARLHAGGCAAVENESEPPPEPAQPRMGRLGAVLLGLFILALLGGGVVGTAALVVWLKSLPPANSPAAHGPPAGPANTSGPAVAWADAAKPLVHESISVKIGYLEFGEVMSRDERNNPVSAGSGDFLQVYFEVENRGNGDLSYVSWQGSEFEVGGELVVAQLSDEEGRIYKPHRFDGFQRIKGHTPQATLQRGAITSDVLVFAVPKATVDAANSFWLELPAGAFARATSGGDRVARGFFRFEIGADMLSEL